MSSREKQTIKANKIVFEKIARNIAEQWLLIYLDDSELPNNLLKDIMAEQFAKVQGKCKILGILRDKELENSDSHGCHKNRDHGDPSADRELWICSSYPWRDKTTLHSEEPKGIILSVDNAAFEVVNFEL